jgi:hypothetical protein
VKIGQLKIPRWIPDTDVCFLVLMVLCSFLLLQTPNEDLQNFSRPNKRALHKKAKSRSRKKVTTKDIRQEVIGELEDWD